MLNELQDLQKTIMFEQMGNCMFDWKKDRLWEMSGLDARAVQSC